MRPGRDRREQAQERHDRRLIVDRHHSRQERGWHRRFVDSRYQSAAQTVPEPARPKHRRPPPSPAHQRAPVDAEQYRERGHALLRRAVLHRRAKKRHRTDVHRAAKEAHRWGRPSTTTAFDCAAEAPPHVVVVAQFDRAAARFARVVGDIQPTAAPRASSFTHSRREVVVELWQQRQDPGVEKRFVAQGRPPFDFAVERRGTPRRLEWSSSSRASAIPLRRPPRNSLLSPRQTHSCSCGTRYDRAVVHGSVQIPMKIASFIRCTDFLMKRTLRAGVSLVGLRRQCVHVGSAFTSSAAEAKPRLACTLALRQRCAWL